MTEIWEWPQCSLCHFVQSSLCFLFPNSPPGSLSSPSAMIAVWEVRVGFLSVMSGCAPAIQAMCQTSHFSLGWRWSFVILSSTRMFASYRSPFFPPNKILLSLCETKTDVQMICALAHSKSIQSKEKALMGLSCVRGIAVSLCTVWELTRLSWWGDWQQKTINA